MSMNKVKDGVYIDFGENEGFRLNINDWQWLAQTEVGLVIDQVDFKSRPTVTSLVSMGDSVQDW